jgi:hypothetical protein
MRLAAYTGVSATYHDDAVPPLTRSKASVALATGVFLKALHQRANFYAASVYLSQSSANLMVSSPSVCSRTLVSQVPVPLPAYD